MKIVENHQKTIIFLQFSIVFHRFSLTFSYPSQLKHYFFRISPFFCFFFFRDFLQLGPPRPGQRHLEPWISHCRALSGKEIIDFLTVQLHLVRKSLISVVSSLP